MRELQVFFFQIFLVYDDNELQNYLADSVIIILDRPVCRMPFGVRSS